MLEDGEEEEKILKEQEKGAESMDDFKRIKKIEHKLEKLSNSVYQLFQKYDEQM